jgi:NADH-quinone oxidoreductase subunit A
VEQLLSIGIFLGFGLGFVLVNLLVGKLVRPSLPNAEKRAIYECGEPTIGSSWVQFDLRFYIVALFYLVFDVEVALIYPWAVVFRDFPKEAVVLGAPFFAVIVIGYAYEWYSGSLDWVRSAVTVAVKTTPGVGPALMGAPGTALARGADLAALARRDPNALEDEAVATQGH